MVVGGGRGGARGSRAGVGGDAGRREVRGWGGHSEHALSLTFSKMK